MRRILFPAAGLLAAVALIFVALGAAPAQPMPPAEHPTLPGLEGVPPEQLFDHFTGAQIFMTDNNGNPMTVNVTPGTVASLEGNDVVITPNGQTTTQTFRITADTVVHGMPNRGSVFTITQGDKVVVVTIGSSMDAIVIAEKGMMGHMQGGRWMNR